jgi:putative FmdB family regulatory protein
MLRMYDYQCTHCREYATEYRDMDDVYKPFTCPHCGLVSDGRAAKKIITSVGVVYRQGKLKGRMNSGNS